MIDRFKLGWLRTHWKVIVAVWLGLSLCGGGLGIFLLHNSEVTRLAISQAESNPALVAELGNPMKTGWFISGSIEVQPGTGHAELAIPISGPSGKGTVYSEARKDAGVWHLSLLQYGKDGSSNRLDLLSTQRTNPAHSQ